MYRSASITPRQAGTAAVAGLMLAAFAHAGHAHASSGSSGNGTGKTSHAARAAIAYARAQLGKPYCWGGTGPSCYDCSGLVMKAWSSAGRSIPRTSEEQWADLPHVPASQRQAGDLVLAPGADGSWASPGHVGLLIGKNTVIQAYGYGTPIEISSLPSFGAAAGGIVGYVAVR